MKCSKGSFVVNTALLTLSTGPDRGPGS
jgi:hypothetical protein